MGERPRVIDHIGVGVGDFEESLDFYTRALSPLGFERVAFIDVDNRSAGFGVHVHGELHAVRLQAGERRGAALGAL